MRLTFFLFIYFNFSLCFAQTNPMEYFYKGRCEEFIPDFAALAVLERQNCPRPVALSYEEYKEQICSSRYRIIKVLDAVSDTLRKEYLEVKEKPVSPYFRHRPMLIFGKHENGILQVKEYEEVRGYFFPHYEKVEILGGCFNCGLDISPLDTTINGYILHSIGTLYHSLKNLDSIDIIFYKYWMQLFKVYAERAGKDFGELQRQLVQNREPIKAIKIKNGFAAIGTIENLLPASDSKQTNLYELNVAIEFVFKNDAKIDSNIAIFIGREHLPLNWNCLASEELFLRRKPVYLFGNLKDGSLFIDSLIFPRDAFVFGDTIYDISMGLPLKKLLTYFLPSNVSLDELEFGSITSRVWGADLVDRSECLKKDIKKMSIKFIDYFKLAETEIKEMTMKEMTIKFTEFLDEETRKLLRESRSFNHFRCHNHSQIGCCSGLKGGNVWGKK